MTEAGKNVTGPAFPELRRLRAFVVVAEELNFRRAAVRLVMSQSPLSRVIKGLEHDIGVALFTRSRRSVALTIEGAAMLDDARALLRLAEHAVARARQLGGA